MGACEKRQVDGFRTLECAGSRRFWSCAGQQPGAPNLLNQFLAHIDPRLYPVAVFLIEPGYVIFCQDLEVDLYAATFTQQGFDRFE